jgi:hypothetical protein
MSVVLVWPVMVAVFKRKAERFSERVKTLAGGNGKSGSSSDGTTLTAISSIDDVARFLSTFVTPSRYTAVISKVGKPVRTTSSSKKKGGGAVTTQTDPIDGITSLYISDVMEDANEEVTFTARWRTLGAAAQKQVTTLLQKQVRTFVASQLAK